MTFCTDELSHNVINNREAMEFSKALDDLMSDVKRSHIHKGYHEGVAKTKLRPELGFEKAAMSKSIYDEPTIAHPQWRKGVYKPDPRLTDRLSVEQVYSGPMRNLYFPFGSAGGGAPNVDKDGNPQTLILGEQTLKRDLKEEAVKDLVAKQYNNELGEEMLEQKLNRLKDELENKKTMTDFAEIMSKGATGRPRKNPTTGELLNQGLCTTDVTNWDFKKLPFMKQSEGKKNLIESMPSHMKDESEELKRFRREDFITKLISDRLHNCLDTTTQSYGNDLRKAADETMRMKRLNRLQDQQEAQEHTKHFSTFWGKPGAGAPNTWGTKKVKLDNILGYEEQLGNIGTNFRLRHRRLAEDSNDDSGYVVQDIAPSGSLYERKAYVHPSGLKSHPKLSVKLPIKSKHENFYELPRNEVIDGPYCLYPPYASSI